MLFFRLPDLTNITKENSCNCNLHNLTRNQNKNKINLFIDKKVYFIAEKLFLI